MKTKAFSLIELSVVMLILAIAAAAVSLRVRGPLQQAQMKDLLGQIVQFDYLTRTYARQHDQPVIVSVNLDAGLISRTSADGSRTVGGQLELPSRCRIGQVVLAGEAMDRGSAVIRCSRRGLTRSYAMRIEETNGPIQWVVISGLTGDALEPKDETQVKDNLAAIGGPDAH